MSRIVNCSTDENRGCTAAAAVDAVRAGRLVVMPTGTVYGLGCGAFDNQTVASLLHAKHRGPDMPVPVLMGSWNTIGGLAREYSPVIHTLVEASWPGKLSLVTSQAPSLPWDLGDTTSTVMLHMPLYPIAIEVLHRTSPMAVSGASISGQAPATNTVRAEQMLGGGAAAYVDSGEATIGTSSTIADISTPVPRILREGAASAAAAAGILSTTPKRLLGQQSWLLKVFPV